MKKDRSRTWYVDTEHAIDKVCESFSINREVEKMGHKQLDPTQWAPDSEEWQTDTRAETTDEREFYSIEVVLDIQNKIGTVANLLSDIVQNLSPILSPESTDNKPLENEQEPKTPRSRLIEHLFALDKHLDLLYAELEALNGRIDL